MTTATAPQTLTYETTECTRCGGTGHFSYNQRTGTTCFKCSGTRVQLTRAGKAAFDKVTAWREATYTVAASQVQPGMRIHLTYPKSVWATVTNVTVTLGYTGSKSRTGTEGTEGYTESWALGKTVLETRHGGYQTWGAHSPVVALPPADEYRVALHQFARTIKRGVTVPEATA
jgi:hypothetical protein